MTVMRMHDQTAELRCPSMPHTHTLSPPTQPKYISQLKKVAEKRKLEQELIYERKVQRDMEKEGLDAEDTEAYHTSAYRKKLEERKAMEEELRKEEEIESECL